MSRGWSADTCPLELDRRAALELLSDAAAGNAAAARILMKMVSHELSRFLKQALCFASMPTVQPPADNDDPLAPFPSQHNCLFCVVMFESLMRRGLESALAERDHLPPLYLGTCTALQ
jgi:hypothetical protein